MCTYCGCGVNSVGSASGITPVDMFDATAQGESGLTSGNSATAQQAESIAEEDPVHEMSEGMVDPE